MCLALCITVLPAFADDEAVDAPRVLLTDVAFTVTADAPDDGVPTTLLLDGAVVATAMTGALSAEIAGLPATGTATLELRQDGSTVWQRDIPVIPGWMSLLPPLVAILLAFLLRAVIPALFVGLVIGAWAVNGLTFDGLLRGFFETVTIYIVETAIDPDHIWRFWYSHS